MNLPKDNFFSMPGKSPEGILKVRDGIPKKNPEIIGILELIHGEISERTPKGIPDRDPQILVELSKECY